MVKNKLVISCATLGSGGAERVISVLTTPFADHFDSVIICLWISSPIFYKIDDRVEIVDIEKKAGSKSIIKKMIWFRRFIKNESPDLLLSFLYPWSMKVIMSLLFTKTPIVVAERQDPRVVRGGWLTKALRHLLYLRAKGILVQTNENKQYYTGRLNNKVFAIYNPVSMSEEWVGKALDSPKDDVIVTVGRLNPAKNHPLLINAFGEFVKKHPSYKLLIYGDGPLKNDMERLIDEKRLSERVLLKGATKDVFSQIVSAKAFVLSSDYEGMPNALIEAMCLGLPCISTKVSGATELIESDKNGLLIDSDAQQLIDALERVLDSAFSTSLSNNAVQVYEKVRLDSICKQWISYLDNFCNGV